MQHFFMWHFDNSFLIMHAVLSPNIILQTKYNICTLKNAFATLQDHLKRTRKGERVIKSTQKLSNKKLQFLKHKG